MAVGVGLSPQRGQLRALDQLRLRQLQGCRFLSGVYPAPGFDTIDPYRCVIHAVICYFILIEQRTSILGTTFTLLTEFRNFEPIKF